MKSLYDKLRNDIHMQEGLNACINCGKCTAICPAAEFYNYNPRDIMIIVQEEKEEQLEALLKSNTIWYCGECMSCRTRCPRNNVPGLVIMALRALSQETGLFVESEKGRQQIYLKRTIGHNILKTGYCLFLEGATIENHPELGPLWEWRQKYWKETMLKVGANCKRNNSGALRKISTETLNEISAIFSVTGGYKHFDNIENFSKSKAAELKLTCDESINNEYIQYIIRFKRKIIIIPVTFHKVVV